MPAPGNEVKREAEAADHHEENGNGIHCCAIEEAEARIMCGNAR